IRPGQPDDFSVRNLAAFADVANASSTIMTILLASIASVSLLVGGIGIMNIMLVSVTERTREIGIRMAVGATEADVQRQFLIEALVLAGVGGGAGGVGRGDRDILRADHLLADLGVRQLAGGRVARIDRGGGAVLGGDRNFLRVLSGEEGG